MDRIKYKKIFTNSLQGKNNPVILNAKVIKRIQFTEEKPDEAYLSQLYAMETVEKTPYFVRFTGGLICSALGTVSFIYALSLKFGGASFGDIDTGAGVAFNPFIIVFGAIGLALIGLAVGLFRKDKATTPVKSFKRIWNAYFRSPDYFTEGVTAVGSMDEIVNKDIPDKLESLYPVKIPFSKENISAFTDAFKNLARSIFDQIPFVINVKQVYGVNYLRNEVFNVIPFGETLASVQGTINVVRRPKEDKAAKNHSDCIELDITMYFVKLNSHWAPVNYVPKFTQPEFMQPELKSVNNGKSFLHVSRSEEVPPPPPLPVMTSKDYRNKRHGVPFRAKEEIDN
jgi:hypothetical protein